MLNLKVFSLLMSMGMVEQWNFSFDSGRVSIHFEIAVEAEVSDNIL